MKVTRKDLPKSIVELTIEESVENIAPYRKKAITHLEKHADIKGFRKGAKIPEAVLIRQYGEEYIAQMTIDFAIDALYKEALKKEKVLPVAQAEITDVPSQSPLKFIVHIEVLPNISIDAKYKKISLTKTPITVAEKEVDAAIADIEQRFTRFEAVGDKRSSAKLGDRITIDTQGYDREKLLEQTAMQDYPLILGSGVLVPGFEDGLVGAKIEEDLSLDITFPKDYHNADFAGKKTKFTVKVKKLEKAVKPEFTPEFIEQLRGKKLDMKAFRELIKEEISETKEMNARIDDEAKLIDELLKVTTLDIGDALLKNQIEKVYAEIKENITKDGIKIGHYLESLKLTEEEYKEKNVQPVALKRLQGELILHKLMEVENVEVSDAEIEAEVQKILARFESSDVLARLKELYVPGNKYYEELRQRTAYRKLIDSFFQEEKKKTTAKK